MFTGGLVHAIRYMPATWTSVSGFTYACICAKVKITSVGQSLYHAGCILSGRIALGMLLDSYRALTALERVMAHVSLSHSYRMPTCVHDVS